MGETETDAHSGKSVNLRCGPGHDDVVVPICNKPEHGFVVRVFDKFVIRLVNEHEPALSHLEHEFLHCIFLDDGRDRVIRIDDVNHGGIRANRAAHGREVGVQVFIDPNPNDLDTGILCISQEPLEGGIDTHDGTASESG